jgi:hypothetical protein
MSERNMNLNLEHHQEALPGGEVEKALPEGHVEKALTATSETSATAKLEQARVDAEQSASRQNPFERLKTAEKSPTTPQQLPINRELKRITLQRELSQLRRKLPVPERLLSRVIHQPAVRQLSEATGQSLTRPSGLLGGGLMAFLGSSAYLYLARHIGFTYNYSVFWLLFVGGFVFGVGLEILVWLFTARRRTDS